MPFPAEASRGSALLLLRLRLRFLLLFFGLGFRLSLAFGFGATIRTGARRRLAGIIGHIPTRALELHGRRMQQLLDLATAFRAASHGLIGKLLYAFKAMTALLAFVLVEWHPNS